MKAMICFTHPAWVHQFHHIIWRMRCYYMVCRRKSPEFVWADAQRRRADVALPTAFRMFVEA